MCQHCDYAQILEAANLNLTTNRLKILEIIGNNRSPLSAKEIYDTLSRNKDINRVTVYRILDLLVKKGIINRLTSGERTFHYGMAPNKNHPAHPHFYCKHCGAIECLNPEALHIEMESLKKTYPGVIENVEIRVDGICKNCLKKSRQ